MKKKIMAVGLNPALQKLLNFPKFCPGEVNRARELSYISGGKAANFAKAAISNGTGAVIYQFAGGAAGEKYCEILKLEDLPFINQITSVETRTCTTVLNDKNSSVTELIEPSGTILEKEAKRLLAQCLNDLPKFQALALCGTFPPGIKAKFYAKLAHQAKKLKIPVLMDACIDIVPVLEEGIEILKINLKELKSLTGKRKVETAAHVILKNYPINIVAITDGPSFAHLFLRQQSDSKNILFSYYEYSIPQLKKVINPIGAGDTVSAVLLSEYLTGIPIHEAFKLALGAGSASCLSHQNAVFDAKFAKKLAATEIKLREK